MEKNNTLRNLLLSKIETIQWHERTTKRFNEVLKRRALTVIHIVVLLSNICGLPKCYKELEIENKKSPQIGWKKLQAINPQHLNNL